MKAPAELESARARYRERFDAFEARLGSAESAGLRQLRRDAIERFAERGLPSTRLEAWRYTNVAPIAKVDFELGSGDAEDIRRSHLEEIAFPVFACNLFAFVNGHFVPALSAPGAGSASLHVESLASLRRRNPALLEARLGRGVDVKEHAFAALNTAFLDDGAVITIPDGADVDQPIHLVFVSTGDAQPSVSHPRVLLRAGRGSRATVVQDHVSIGVGTRFTNAVTEVEVAPGAGLDLVLLQRENEGTYHVSNTSARLERDARFACHTLTLGGALVRNDLEAVLADEGVDCTLNGLFLGLSRQLIDNHTTVDHAMPHGTSRELYKGILGGRSRGVFRGRVIVRPDAQHTNAEQSNPNMLMSDRAEISTKPQLEIHADDVKCSHGSAIGRLDEDALFYLRSRGIAEPAARDLLTRGFAEEILGELPARSLGECLGEILLERLHRAATS